MIAPDPPAGLRSLPWHLIKSLMIERNSLPLPLSLVFTHRRTHLTGQVKWGEEQLEATASLRAKAALLWSSTADMIIDGTPLPSLWIQAALISAIFISKLQKKRLKGQKNKNPVSQQNLFTQILMRSFTNRGWNSSALPPVIQAGGSQRVSQRSLFVSGT